MVKRKKYVIAIDGPAGAGKSTIAKIVARRLGYIYIDTGAMYRAIAFKALKLGTDLASSAQLAALARKSRIELKRAGSELKVLLDGRDVSKEIRKEKVTKHTNTVASVSGVRKVLRQMQRKMGKNGGVVMEGRDIGTAVFPGAKFKFYLDASPEERAKRRYKELLAKKQKVNLKHIASAIARRDYLDKTRGINPLKQARDAVRIDSTKMTLKGVANFIIGNIRKVH